MEPTNGEILRQVEAQLLTPAAVARIIQEVMARLRPTDETLVPHRTALQAELTLVEQEIVRYTAAVAQAPDLTPILDALRTLEARRHALRAELGRLDRLGRITPVRLPPAVATTLS